MDQTGSQYVVLGQPGTTTQIAASNSAAAANGIATLPGIVRTAISAGTAGRSTGLSVDGTNGSLNVRLTDAATYTAATISASSGLLASGYNFGMATTTPTLVAAGATATSSYDQYSALRVNQTAPYLFSSGGTCANVATTTQCLGLSGAGLSYYISSIFFAGTTSTQTFAVWSSATAGNACATSPTVIWGSTYVPYGGGGAISLPDPIKVTANSALCCYVGTASSSTCMLTGRIAP